ncbi:hypothetical protein B0T20DRAFT_407372 [Sordaria brevicollis]|uniref:Secreted protein n=1 Tax=Sordaria brevicollis TaxID=83679 RepID=A0AAE0UDY1_SORBR|nr:hypothetical protein B0T20DRAFT_407372 [Sordaria brevicollis]
MMTLFFNVGLVLVTSIQSPRCRAVTLQRTLQCAPMILNAFASKILVMQCQWVTAMLCPAGTTDIAGDSGDL